MKYKEFYLLSENVQYIGNCTDSFCKNTGDCQNSCFVDVSDFGNKEEEFRDEVDNGRDLFMTFDEFKSIVGDEPILASFEGKNMEYYFYEGSQNIYVAYDMDEDIHYFFK